MSIQITWFGHATWQIQAPPHWIIVDPFFDENPVCEKSADKVECDYILLTHGHFDHVADAVSIAKRTGAQVLSNYEISNWLRKQGVASVMGMNLGGSFKTKFGSVKMTPALHSSMLPDGTDGGVAGGFVLECESNRIYFAGDTALFSDMSLIARKPIDVYRFLRDVVRPRIIQFIPGLEPGDFCSVAPRTAWAFWLPALCWLSWSCLLWLR